MITEYSDLVVTQLVSANKYQVFFGLSVVYICEFLKVYLGPVLFRVINIVLSLIVPRRSLQRTESMVPEETLLAKEKYKSPTDDRKSSKGTENDLYMLKTHGYDKYRFVSNSFLKRNNLVRKKLVGPEEH